MTWPRCWPRSWEFIPQMLSFMPAMRLGYFPIDSLARRPIGWLPLSIHWVSTRKASLPGRFRISATARQCIMFIARKRSTLSSVFAVG